MKLLLLLFYFFAARSVEVQVEDAQFQAVPMDAVPQVEIIPAAPVKPAEEKAPEK